MRGDLQKGPLQMSSSEFRERFGKDHQCNAALAKLRKPQIRMPELKEPNATEAAYGSILAQEFPMYTPKYEAISFRLNSGTNYRPDWTVWDGPRLVLCVEVKGGFIHRNASKEKFKQARAEWRDIRWRFAQGTKVGKVHEWAITEQS